MKKPSSLIRAMMYDETAQTLQVTLTSGRRYSYTGVDAKTARNFENAESAGRFFSTHIRDRFPTQLMPDEE